jgi:sterol desaturase/sphingolipid hydroxylase (fatty acid hydroxylase superfamily)
MAAWMNHASLGTIVLGVVLAIPALTSFCVAIGFAQESIAKKRNRLIFDVPLGKGQLRHEMIGTLTFHLIFVPCAAVVWWKLARFTSGWRADVATFLVCLYSFQIYYYGFHRAMHTDALYRFHKWHHRSHVMTPLAGLSMGPVEALGWTLGILGPVVILGQVGWLGAWGLLALLAFHWYGNITGHANADFIPRPFGTKLVSTFANPVTYHALHHARFQGHYGFGAAYMDRLGRTEFSDWQKVHALVMTGRPLRRMGETVE